MLKNKHCFSFLMLLLVFSVNAQIDGDPDIGDLSAPSIFYDKFEAPLHENTWKVEHRIWGQPTYNGNLYLHGGVIQENCYTENGNAVMRSLEDYYNGPLTSFNGEHNTRMGAAMLTDRRFASGRFETKMKIIHLKRQNI
ncbi:hypothetical protein [Flavivirga eckloniae]|uniref:Uncharacterized protein n=1 Tax=Flavivirga eckloniae TaxID=1803846 RepID=A0A2K9PW40_9FLAO|nr:hypothetical protein [Flavivirga eckloniae]AUP81276.1 hypothetical protein C1H87_22175 [Flavivirga eckloniae]